MRLTDTLLLTRQDTARLLTIQECIIGVEQAFKSYGCGKAAPPGILGIHAAEGGFHIKAGMLNLDRNYFVAKTNANFPANAQKHGLPTIQGVISVFDADNGRLLALMDSIEITIIRTGVATAVAAKYLSVEDSKTVTIWGCGNQGRISLRALMKVRNLKTAYVYDIDKEKAALFAKEFSEELKISTIAVDDPGKAVRHSDICVTCTPSKEPFLRLTDLKPGTFIAAVGADSENKQELYPEVLSRNKVIADMREQSEHIGELHHALKAGPVGLHAELGEIIAGKKAGRESTCEIIIFDSTGMALQDVVASAIVYEKALESGTGFSINFGKKDNDDPEPVIQKSHVKDIAALKCWFPFK